MIIDKATLPNGIWYEDKDGNYIPHDSASIDVPPNADTMHVCFPLEITERIYAIDDDENGRHCGKQIIEGHCHISRGSEPTIMGMVNSGDYTLAEALALYSSCCERCMNVLTYKYTNGADGYAEYSEEWQKCNTFCKHCGKG